MERRVARQNSHRVALPRAKSALAPLLGGLRVTGGLLPECWRKYRNTGTGHKL